VSKPSVVLDWRSIGKDTRKNPVGGIAVP